MCRGFTPYLRDDYLEWKREGRLVNDGVNAKVRWWHLLHVGLPSSQAGTPADVACLVLIFSCSYNPMLQLLGNHGPLDAREPGQIFEGPARLWRVPVHA